MGEWETEFDNEAKGPMPSTLASYQPSRINVPFVNAEKPGANRSPRKVVRPKRIGSPNARKPYVKQLATAKSISRCIHSASMTGVGSASPKARSVFWRSNVGSSSQYASNVCTKS